MSRLDKYVQTGGNSKSLSKIDGKNFTVTGVEDSDYTNGDEPPVRGIKITTKESFDIDGEKCNRFHTTRVAIVGKFAEGEELREAVNEKNDPVGPVKCVKMNSQNGKSFFQLVDADWKKDD